MKQAQQITFITDDIKFVLHDKEKLRKWISLCLKNQQKKMGTIAFVFCSDNYLLKINKEYLKHNTLTDIITFDYSEGKIISGEIFISIDRVKENSKFFSDSFRNELHRIIIHGILHLCGHKDKNPSAKKEMTAREDYYLSLRSFKHI